MGDSKMPSIPPGAGRTAAGVGGVGTVGGLLVWAIMTMQGEAEATRATMEKIAVRQAEMVTNQKLVTQELRNFTANAEREHSRQDKRAEKIEDRVERLEGRRRR